MTPENSGSRTRMGDVPWPTTVTPEDLARIDAFRSQGKPLEVGIARVIYDEGKELRDTLMGMVKLPALSPKEQESDEAIDQRMREGTGILIGITMISVNYASAANHILSATGEKAPRAGIEGGGLANALMSGLERDYATSEELSMNEVEQVKMSHVADGLIFDEMIEAEYHRRTPLEFVDYCADIEEQKLRRLVDQQDPSYRIFSEALKRGNQRFHQFYEAMQHELPTT